MSDEKPHGNHEVSSLGAAPSSERYPLWLLGKMLIYGTGFLAFVLVLVPWLWHRLDVYVPAVHVDLDWRLRAVGGVIFVVCLGLYLYNSYVLTYHGKGAFVEFDPPKEFVSTGPYRWVRNPVAASLLGAILGEAILFSSTGILIMFITSVGLAHLQATRVEEPLLKKRFGKSYEDYMKRVPRWIPRRPRDGTDEGR